MHCTRSRHIFRHMHFANGATVQFVGHTFRCNESFATKQMWKVSQCRQIANNSIHFENIAYIMFNWIIYVVIEWTQAARVLSLWMFCILNDAARSVYGFAVTSTKRTSDRPAYDDIKRNDNVTECRYVYPYLTIRTRARIQLVFWICA